MITADDKTLTILQWATWRGWTVGTIRSRLHKGWDPVRAVTEEPRPDMRGTDRDYAEVRRERRRIRAAAGLCIHCAAPTPVEPGKTQCRRHLDETNVGMKELYEAKRELGMCLRCNEPAQPGFRTCAAHGERMAQNANDYRTYKVSVGICTACTKRAVKDHVMCRDHLAARRAEWNGAGKERREEIKAERRAEGLCVVCGAKAKDKKRALCTNHSNRMDAFAARRNRESEIATKGIAPKGAEAVRPGVIRRRRGGEEKEAAK